MDVHQAPISVAVMDDQGKLIMECILETNAAKILEFIQGPSYRLSLPPGQRSPVPEPCFYRAQRRQWEVGLSSPNRILDKTRKDCRAATSFRHQRLRSRRD
jgi:hypothetical protein